MDPSPFYRKFPTILSRLMDDEQLHCKTYSFARMMIRVDRKLRSRDKILLHRNELQR